MMTRTPSMRLICVGRSVDTDFPSPPKSRGTKSGQKRRADEVRPKWPAEGGDFVDASLMVVVRGALGAMTCFLSQKIHGTTDCVECTSAVLQALFLPALLMHIKRYRREAALLQKRGQGKTQMHFKQRCSFVGEQSPTFS